MQMRALFFLANSIVTFVNFSGAQTWVESYLYNGTELNSEKWSPGPISIVEPVVTFTGSHMNLKTRWNSSSSSSSWQPFMISSDLQREWYRNVPLNQDWSILQRMQPIYEPMSSFIAGIYVKSSDSLIRAVSAFEYIQYGDNQSNGQARFFDGATSHNIIANWDFQWVGISYESSNNLLRSVYSTSNASEISNLTEFTTFRSQTISLNSDDALIIGQESRFNEANGNLNISEFKIVSYAVPEPSALSLLAVGLGGLALLRQGRKKD